MDSVFNSLQFLGELKTCSLPLLFFITGPITAAKLAQSRAEDAVIGDGHCALNNRLITFLAQVH